VHQRLKVQTHRRFPKTHLPIDGLPLSEDIRYIHVARDGRGALMSMHNYYTGFNGTQLEQFDKEDPMIGRPYPRVPVFEGMQAAGDTLMPGIVDRFVGGSRRMFNEGRNGR
jgi:hypothetical protein